MATASMKTAISATEDAGPRGTRLSCSSLSLAAERERRGLSLEDIERSTRIAHRFLQAIETEDFSNLPGGVYNTSYIRQYARAIGYSEKALLEHYYAQTHSAPVNVSNSQLGGHLTTRFGEMMELLRGHVVAKARTHHAS